MKIKFILFILVVFNFKAYSLLPEVKLEITKAIQKSDFYGFLELVNTNQISNDEYYQFYHQANEVFQSVSKKKSVIDILKSFCYVISSISILVGVLYYYKPTQDALINISDGLNALSSSNNRQNIIFSQFNDIKSVGAAIKFVRDHPFVTSTLVLMLGYFISEIISADYLFSTAFRFIRFGSKYEHALLIKLYAKAKTKTKAQKAKA
jgi:hypothetical protein